MRCFFSLFIVVLFLSQRVDAQSEKEQLIKARVDTTHTLSKPADTITAVAPDTVLKPKHIPRKATFRSAVLPGWGQAYNKQYWKIPFVYAVIGIPAGFYVYNTSWYKRTKLAYDIVVNNDTSRFPEINSKLQGLRAESLQFYRNEFRRNRDYSLLYFIIAWGINVADATVFAHLRDFDVSDDLSFQLKPGHSNFGNTTGISFVLSVKSPAQQRQQNLHTLP